MSFFNTTATLSRASRLPPGTNQAEAVRLLLHDHDFFVRCGPHSVEWEAVSAAEELQLAREELAADAQGVQPLPAVVRAAREAVVARGETGEEEGEGEGEDSKGTSEAGEGEGETGETGETEDTKDTKDSKDSKDSTDSTDSTDDSSPPSQTYRVTDVVHTLPAGLWDSKAVSTYEMTNLANGVFVRVRSPMSIVMDTTWTVEVIEESEVFGSDAGSETDSLAYSAEGSEGWEEAGEIEAEEVEEANKAEEARQDNPAQDGQDENGDSDAPEKLELREQIIIYCSRLLMGTIKGLCEADWESIHERMQARLKGGGEEGEKGKKGKKEEKTEKTEKTEETEETVKKGTDQDKTEADKEAKA